MVCFAPISSSVSAAVTKPLQSPGGPFTQTFPLTGGTNPGSAYQGRFFVGDASRLTTAFEAEVWLAAGPGPVYTNVVRLVHVQGAVATGTEICGQWNKDAILPVVGRAFNTSTDAYVVNHNNGYVTTGNLTSVTLSVDAANASSTDGCCDETLAKLDQILAFISKQYFTQP